MIPNIGRARDYMERYGLSAILVSSPMNVAYFTGFDCWLYQKYTEDMLLLGAKRARKETFAFLAETGSSPVLVTDSYSSLFAWDLENVELRCYGGISPTISEKGAATNHASFFRRALSSQKDTPVEGLTEALKEQGITRGKVAVEMSSTRPETLRALRRALPQVEFLDGELVIALIRMVKSKAEIGLLTTAARINEKALYDSLKIAKAGVPMRDLSRRYMVEIAKEGAVFDHYFNSPDGLWLSGASAYRLRRGEYTIIDSGCTFHLYFADMGTTILVARERQEVKKKYREVWETVDEIADYAGAGVTPSAIMDRFGELYRRKNISTEDYSGHGIGLEPREYPIMGLGGPKAIRDGVISTSTDLPLEPGMVISLETSIYEPGEGSYEIERTFLVGKSSLKELTTKKDSAIFVSEA
jgi:Xaa-Pro aminopeptidase